ncbi:MAG: type VI secretion system tip protein TssI/VgrG [Ignavibacteriota bacterium]
MVPKLWFLSLDADCKIFQNLTVQAIIEQVLQDKGVTDFSFRLNGTYTARDYCVQYRESSLDFISRLLEEEGIFYFFEHTDTKHTLVFSDKSSILPACPDQAVAEYSYDQSGWIQEGVAGVATLERIEAAITGQAAVTDYNFETPNTSLMSNESGSNEEVYDYPGEYGTKSDGQRYVRIRLEEREALQFVVNGSSRCRSFRPATYFKLKGHFRKDTNQDYFLVSTFHNAFDSTYRQNRKDLTITPIPSPRFRRRSPTGRRAIPAARGTRVAVRSGSRAGRRRNLGRQVWTREGPVLLGPRR